MDFYVVALRDYVRCYPSRDATGLVDGNHSLLIRVTYKKSRNHTINPNYELRT
ncbi:hypothetical protein HanXRQr2_Chr07g0299111 [Helianthus annuus]|uniref:Uncharacterized protein n=1 Tax=Helianthus annuus TaxID=4232 RepID=A0A9K3IM26_HELAN|nr:hypothetical protein HanXRQr2_Chr07g0299111 [Helianthus annuus]KAJ0905056.1 hypothetical protein HanPSC8_Chr07g0289591 [Helianthus annuus]